MAAGHAASPGRVLAGDPAALALALTLLLADARVVQPVVQQRLGHVVELAHLAHLQPQVQVLGRVELCVVAADLIERVFAKHRRGVPDRGVALHQLVLDRGIIGRHAERPQHPTAGVDPADPAAGHHHLRPIVQPLQLRLEPPGQGDVVGVHASDQWRAGRGDAGVQGGGHADVIGLEDADAVVGLGGGPQHRAGLIGRAVVDHNQLVAGQRLGGDRIQSRLQVSLPVVDGHHHAYQGISDHHASKATASADQKKFRMILLPSRHSAAPAPPSSRTGRSSRGCHSPCQPAMELSKM